MKALKAITANNRFFNSPPLGIRVIATRTQVSHYIYTPPPPPSLLGRFHDLHFPSSTHPKLYFSSKSNSVVERILTNDWSLGLERELEKCGPSLTHEAVIYILKQLEKNPAKAFSFFNWVRKREWFLASSSMFNIIVIVLANKVTIKQFWITLCIMKEKGFYLYPLTYKSIMACFGRENMNRDYACLRTFFKRMLQQNARQTVVTKVVGIISGSEWGGEVMNELAKLKIPLSDTFVTRVLKELQIRSSSPLKAYKFFDWAGKQSHYQQNTITYNAVARVLARPGSIDEFWSIIEEMKSVGYELDIDTYVKISRQLQTSGMMVDAVRLYELMMDSSYKPSLQDCIILLKSISENDLPISDLAFRVVKKSGNALSKEIYDGIHRCLTSAGKFDEAEDIVNNMKNAGYEPDNITFSQLVYGLCKMKRLEEACEVLDEMESCGCIPDSNTWSILIQGHCAANEVDKALLCLGKTIEKGCHADAAALGALVDSFLSQKKIDDAYKLFVEQVSDCRSSPRQHTYEKLSDNLLGIRKFEEALNLFCLMRQNKYTPFNNTIVQYVSKFGTVEDAVKFLKAWRKESPRSHSAYLCVFESFIEEGRFSEAKDILCKCPSRIRRRKEIRDFFGSVEHHMAAA